MESLVYFLIGAGTLAAGSRLLIQSRRPARTHDALGGMILVIVGAMVLIAGFWSMGTLVGLDGTVVHSSTAGTMP